MKLHVKVSHIFVIHDLHIVINVFKFIRIFFKLLKGQCNIVHNLE